MSRKGIETEAKILEVLALNKETAQYDVPEKIGVHYTTVLRQLKQLKKLGKVKVVRTEASEKGGKDKKIYSLTFLGMVQVFLNWNNKEVELKDVIKIAESYPDVGLLSFKKFPLFKKAGLTSLFAEYIKKGVFRAFRKWMRIQEYLKAGLVEENLETVIDRSIITDSIIIDKNKEFREVCKNDSDLKQFIEVDFKRRRVEFNAYEDAKKSWNKI